MILVLILCALQIADIVTTVVALKHGGKEINQLARKLFGTLGVIPAALLLKLVGAAPMVAFALLYPAYWLVPAAYCFVMAGIIANNLFRD